MSEKKTLLADHHHEHARSQAPAWERTVLEAPPSVSSDPTMLRQAEPAVPWVPRQSLGTRLWRSPRSVEKNFQKMPEPAIVVIAITFFLLLFCTFAEQSFAQGNPAPAAKTVANESLFEVVFSGGVMGIGIMIILILLSIVSVYLVVEQAMSLRKKELVPADLAEIVRQLLAQGKLKDADQACRDRPCPLSFVLVSGMSEIEFGWPAVEKALEDSTAEQAARLYRKLEYLSVIGNIAPMLGLLGTVTGMILAFREVALSQGTAGAGALASGIYSALVTTVAGLVIAIPCLSAFAIFRNKIDEIISDTAYSAQHVFSSVRRRIPGATVARSNVASPPRG